MNEAMGKILGMAMAYGVSSLGLLLAYVNYRKRIVKAEKVMSSQAWMVVVASVLAIAAGAGVVSQLAARAQESDTAPAAQPLESSAAAQKERAQELGPATARRPPDGQPRPRWPWIGIVVPGAIFLLATWITGTLHRRFSATSHPPRD